MFRLKAPASLAAVFLMIALVAAVLVGGRLIQDWNSKGNVAPVGVSRASALAELEARPLHLPVMAKVNDCVTGPLNAAGDYGSGPVFGVGGQTTDSTWGTYYHNLAYAETPISGPVLVRARDVFTHVPVVFVGAFVAGQVVGTDTLAGKTVQQHTELLLDPKNQGSLSPYWSQIKAHKYDWAFTAGVVKSWSGATEWQLDGPSFSEVFVVC